MRRMAHQLYNTADMYATNTAQWQQHDDVKALATVAKNESQYTHQNSLQEFPQGLCKQIGFPTLETVKHLISSLTNCPVSSGDLNRAYKINGKEVGNIQTFQD
jgi:hypothetical protein